MRALKHVVYIIMLTLIIAGCSNTNQANENNKGAENPLDPTNHQSNDPDLHDKLGYVKYSKEELENTTAEDKQLTVDRNELADNIARMILHDKAFSQVATLVTDHEVLIAYSKNEDADAKRAESFAKQSATAIIPRYYEVYVSDNSALIRDIESLHNSSVLSNDYSKTLDRIIEDMENTNRTPRNE